MKEKVTDGYDQATGEHVRVVQLVEPLKARAPKQRIFEKFVLVSQEGLKRMHDAKLTKTELTVWTYMHMHARTDDAFRLTVKRLCQDHGWDSTRAHLAIGRLMEVGLIDRIDYGVYGPNPEASWVGSGVGHQQAMEERHPESGEKNREPSAQEGEA